MLLSVALSGCLGGTEAPGTPQTSPDPQSPVVGAFDAKTGAIEGFVVDEALVPIAGAAVVLNETGANVTANKIGSFAFDHVQPGRYTVWAARDGYLPAAASADVRAGSVTNMQIQLPLDRNKSAYHEILPFTGYWACKFNIVIGAPGCEAVGLDVGGEEVTGFEFEVGDHWKNVVIELTWEETSAVGQTAPGAMFSNLGRAPADEESRCFGEAYGEQEPVVLRLAPGANASEFGCSSPAGDFYDVPPDSGYRHWGWAHPWGMLHDETTTAYNAWSPGQSRGVGVTIAQRFDMYFTVFYNEGAPEAFSALPDE